MNPAGLSTSTGIDALLTRLRIDSAVLVRVESTEGSAPREAGTWMAVWSDGLTGTIGGGQAQAKGQVEGARRGQGSHLQIYTALRAWLRRRLQARLTPLRPDTTGPT